MPDVFEKLEVITKRELNDSIQLHWFDLWTDYQTVGGWLDAPDSVDFAELVISTSEELGVDNDSNIFDSNVGKTVRNIWTMT